LAVPDLIATLRSEMGHIHIIVLTLDPDMEAAALAVGADIVVCKTGPPQKMLAALITAISAQQVELSA
jgi:DNA-binding NarL/FixJ family response regulator